MLDKFHVDGGFIFQIHISIVRNKLEEQCLQVERSTSIDRHRHAHM